MKKIWVAWEIHRRTQVLAAHFNIEKCLLNSRLPRFLKYPLFLTKTLILLLQKKPDVVFVQNPSLVLAFVSCLFKKIFRYKLVLDLHNGAIVPETRIQVVLYFLYRYVMKKSDLNIVTNSNLMRIVDGAGVPTLMLPDKLPVFSFASEGPPPVITTNPFFVAVSTFCGDEPVEEIFEAARLLGDNITFVVTGDYTRCPKAIRMKLPTNVILSGHVSEEDYLRLLRHAEGVIDLTTRDNCLVCGAYEAVALGRPTILTDTVALREYFTGAGLFCQNERNSIRDTVMQLLQDHERYCHEVQCLKAKIDKEWKTYERKLKHVLSLWDSAIQK